MSELEALLGSGPGMVGGRDRVETDLRPVPSLASRRTMQLASRALPSESRSSASKSSSTVMSVAAVRGSQGSQAGERPGSCRAGARCSPGPGGMSSLRRPPEPGSDLFCPRRRAFVRAARRARRCFADGLMGLGSDGEKHGTGFEARRRGQGRSGEVHQSPPRSRCYLARSGRKVLAVDANPDANLAAALGVPVEEQRDIIPISEQRALIEERTGARAGQYGQMFRMNRRSRTSPGSTPSVDDGVAILVLERSRREARAAHVRRGATAPGAGDRSGARQGTEGADHGSRSGRGHLGRATARGVDAMLGGGGAGDVIGAAGSSGWRGRSGSRMSGRREQDGLLAR